MNWILPAIVSTLIGTLAISFVYSFLYLNERKDYLKIWAISWWLYAFRFMFSFLIQKYSPTHFLISIEQSASLLSGIFLLYGTLLFLDKKTVKKWGIIYIILQIWIISGVVLHFSYLYITLPTFLFMGIIYIETGVILFKDKTINNTEHKIAGVTFILWGIHKMNYPFLGTSVWFAPIGFFLGALFEFAIAFSFIFIYYKKNKEDLIRTLNEIKDKTFLLTETQKISHTGSWELNLADNKLIWSEETYRIFGIDDKSREINYEFFLRMVHPEDIKSVNDKYEQSLENNRESYELRHRIINQTTGETRFVFEKCVHICDDNGKICKAIGIVQDITELKKQEEEKELFERKMFQSQKMESIGQLSGGIAHDFNNQLSSILGYSELLSSKITDQQLKNYIGKIIKSVQNSSVLTKQLLSFARIGNYKKQVINLVPVVEDVIDILNHSLDKRVKIKKELNLLDANINGDYTNIQNAVLNIALNSKDAIHGTGEIFFEIGLINIETRKELQHGFEVGPGNYVKLRITDNGSGMTAETLGRIFEPFFTTKKVGKGTGMGLASVFGIIKSHDGAIEVKSEVNIGTEFIIYLPWISKSEITINDNKNESSRHFQNQLSVLIIDDNIEYSIMLKEHLEDSGHIVKLVNNGLDGLGYFSNRYSNIDLVVLDYMMPDISGKEVYDKIKSIKPDQKVILSSGYSTNENDIAEMINDGCITLQKPFSIIKFDKIIEKINKQL